MEIPPGFAGQKTRFRTDSRLASGRSSLDKCETRGTAAPGSLCEGKPVSHSTKAAAKGYAAFSGHEVTGGARLR